MTETALPPLALLRFSALGDVASALRVAHAARGAWPERRIVFISHARYRAVVAALASEVEFVALGEELQSVRDIAAFLRSLQAEVVDLHRSLRTSLVFAQTPLLTWRRLKKRRRKRRALVSGRADALPARYRVQQQQAQLVSGLRLPDEPWLHVEPRGDAEVILVPGAAWPEKRWPLASFHAVACALSARMRVTVLYSRGDDLPIEDFDWGAAQLEGDLDLSGCIELIAGARLVISNDTGFAHIAEGLGVPLRVLIGPTDQRLGAAPQGDTPSAQVLRLGLDCQPCSQKGDRPCHVGGRPCLTGLSPERVLAAAAEVLGVIDVERSLDDSL